MSDRTGPYDGPTLLDTARSMPVETALFSVFPVALAVAQLGIGVATELHVGYATVFAAVLVAYAVLATRYNRSIARLDALD
jgi:hypothetical protein